MNIKELILKAEKLVGEQSPTDYVLQSGNHFKEFEENAPELADILKSSKLESIKEEYDTWNERALDYQRKFRKWSRYANWFAFLTVLFTASILVVTTIPMDEFYLDSGIITFSALSVIFSISTGAALRLIKTGNILHLWMSGRASAETLRIDYFNQLVQYNINSNNVFLSLLKLEYFRRYQLDVELAYYTVRSKQNQLMANKTLSYSTWLMAGATLAIAVGSFLGVGTQYTFLTAITSLAIICQALSSKISNSAAFNQYGKNAENFERTRSSLAQIRGKLDDVRELVANGNNKALVEFASLVNDQISLEHRLWIDTFKKRIESIDTMTEDLKNKQEEEGYNISPVR